MLEKLIGATLEEITEKHIKVKKDDKEYTLDIYDCEGDCCGYNEITANLLVDGKSKPVITNITREDEEGAESSSCRLTFFGLYKPIATLDTYSSSGSGWAYGACVSIECSALDIDEILSEW